MCIWEVSVDKRHCNFCKVIDCVDRIPNARRNGKVMTTMRAMELNSSYSFSIMQYNAVRSASSILKRDYDVLFQYIKKGDNIIVKRVK